MQDSQVNRIPRFIWGIADDVLRDLYVRGKYRDIILPMTVIRRLDAALEPTKQAVLAMGARLDEDGVIEQEAALKQAAGHAFYNASHSRCAIFAPAPTGSNFGPILRRTWMDFRPMCRIF